MKGAGLIGEIPALSLMGLVSFASAFLVASLLYVCGWWPDDFSENGVISLNDLTVVFVLIVIVAPLLETFGLMVLFGVFSTAFGSWLAGLLAALMLAGLHSLKWWGVSVCVAISFYIFSRPFSDGGATFKSYMRSVVMHSSHNFYVFILLAASEFF